MLSLSVIRLVPPPRRIAQGRVLFEERDLLTLPNAAMRDIRGSRIAIIFQEPMTSLNPVFTVGDQITEAMRTHDRLASGADLQRRAVARWTGCVSLRRRGGSRSIRTRCRAECGSG